MTLPTVTVFADDADAYVPRIITSEEGGPMDFAPLVAVGPGLYDLGATWVGDAYPEGTKTRRLLHIPAHELAVGTHRLYLSIPDSNDLDLGYVNVVDRK